MEFANPLASSHLYPYIHRFLLDCQCCQSTGIDSTALFIEIFHLCREAATDQTPGENLSARYIEPLLQRTACKRYTELVFCLVWVVLMVQEHPTYATQTFCGKLQPLIRHSSFYHPAKQLAINIHQHERHLNTDFLILPQSHPDMKVEIDGNPGTGNTFNENNYHISTVEHLNPNATTVITKHYHINGSLSAIQEAALDAAAEKAEQRKQQDTPTIDIQPIKQEILTWVSRLRPLLNDDWKKHYMKDWETILELSEIKEKVYDCGKQQHTNFNRYLICNIIYYLDSCGAYYAEEYRASAMCEALGLDKESSLRKQLGKNPPEDVVKRLRRYFTE